jgi:hypothetical protein
MSNPWLRIDYGQLVDIATIVVYNRESCCQDRIVGATVSITTDFLGNNVVWSSIFEDEKASYTFDMVSTMATTTTITAAETFTSPTQTSTTLAPSTALEPSTGTTASATVTRTFTTTVTLASTATAFVATLVRIAAIVTPSLYYDDAETREAFDATNKALLVSLCGCNGDDLLFVHMEPLLGPGGTDFGAVEAQVVLAKAASVTAVIAVFGNIKHVVDSRAPTPIGNRSVAMHAASIEAYESNDVSATEGVASAVVISISGDQPTLTITVDEATALETVGMGTDSSSIQGFWLEPSSFACAYENRITSILFHDLWPKTDECRNPKQFNLQGPTIAGNQLPFANVIIQQLDQDGNAACVYFAPEQCQVGGARGKIDHLNQIADGDLIVTTKYYVPPISRLGYRLRLLADYWGTVSSTASTTAADTTQVSPMATSTTTVATSSTHVTLTLSPDTVALTTAAETLTTTTVTTSTVPASGEYDIFNDIAH